jgi:hypothetical protein
MVNLKDLILTMRPAPDGNELPSLREPDSMGDVCFGSSFSQRIGDEVRSTCRGAIS